MQSTPANSWTVLVYLHADHNLDPSSVIDIQEMQKVGSSNTFNIVVQWDRAEVSGVQRGVVRQGKFETVQKMPELNSDDPKVLAEFISWGIQKYPARRYGLIMWDHGGQWDGGFGGDETNEGGGMTVPDMRRAIQAGMAQSQQKKFEFMSFDTCLMGGIELLASFADLASLYIANPELDFGDGWEYTNAFGYLKNNPSVPMNLFAQKENEYWGKHHSVEEVDILYRAHSAYDSSKLGLLLNASKNFSSAMLNVWESEGEQLAALRSRVIEYNIDTDEPRAPKNYVDLGHLAALVAKTTQDAALKTASNELQAAIKSAVIAKTLGKNNQAASGISIWLPADSSELPDSAVFEAYAQLYKVAESGWNTFLDSWFGAVQGNSEAPMLEILETRNLVSPNATNTAQVDFSVAGTDLDGVYATIGREVGQEFRLYTDLFFDRAEEGDFTAEWDGSLIYVSDGKNRDLFTGFFQDAGDTLLAATAQYSEPKDTQTTPVIVLMNAETLRITAMLDDSGSSPREMVARPGATLEFEYLRYETIDDEDPDFVGTGGKVLIPQGGIKALRAGYSPAPKGDYSLVFGVTDWAGNEQTDDVSIKIQ
jgi:Clostripain family